MIITILGNRVGGVFCICINALHEFYLKSMLHFKSSPLMEASQTLEQIKSVAYFSNILTCSLTQITDI